MQTLIYNLFLINNMQFKEELKRLKESKEFKVWEKENKRAYLTHFFTMIKQNNQTPWQLGYYDKKTDKVTAFFMEKEIKISPPAEVFKKQGIVKPLDITHVKIELDKALKISEQEQKKYKETIAQTIVTLQNLDLGTTWNITYLTHSFNAINFKIDVKNGKILHQGKTTFLEHKAS